MPASPPVPAPVLVAPPIAPVRARPSPGPVPEWGRRLSAAHSCRHNGGR